MKKSTKIFLIIISVIIAARLIHSFAVVGLEQMQPAAPKIAVVNVIGEIYQSAAILEKLEKAFTDDQFKGVVIRIDSPGGIVGACQEIFAEIMRHRGKKPIVASAGSLCASGGYYIASAADSIIVNPGTLIGSIGVIMVLPYLRGLYEKIGIDFRVITSGDLKDAGSPTRELTEKEKEYFNFLLSDAHKQFVGHIAKGRNMDTATVMKSADGRIFLGEQAVELGLADQIGNLNDAVNLAAKMAGLEEKPQAVIIEKDKTVIEQLYERFRAAIPHSNINRPQGIYYLFGY